MRILRDDFGDRLKGLRLEHKMTQEALARELGVSKGAYNNYENASRTPDIDFLDAAAKYFGVTSEYLLGHSNARAFGNISICEQTGLSESAVEELKRLRNYEDDSFASYDYQDVENHLQMMDLINILIGTRYDTTNINGENVSETYFSLIMQAALQYIEVAYTYPLGNGLTENLLNNAGKWEAVEIFKDFLDEAARRIANDLKEDKNNGNS